MTANLQGRVSVRDAARLMNVSERTVYMARELLQTGRADLCAACERGEISLLAALRAAKPEKYRRAPNPGTLVKAWQRASEAERQALLSYLQGAST